MYPRSRSSKGLTQHYLRDESAVAAVEFAVALPFMLLLLFGAIDLTDGITANQKVVLAASTTSDLVARVVEVDDDYLNNTFSAASAIMKPFDDTSLVVTISSIVVDKNGDAKVAWSKSNKGASPHGRGKEYPLEAEHRVPGNSLIISEVSYDLPLLVGYLFKGAWNMDAKAHASPRVAPSGIGVTCSAPGCT